MTRIPTPSLPFVAIVLLSALLQTVPRPAQAQTRLDTPAWRTFRDMTVRYDSITAALDAMVQSNAVTRGNQDAAQRKVQEEAQKHAAFFQQYTQQAITALAEVGPADGYTRGDLRLLRTAATNAVSATMQRNDTSGVSFLLSVDRALLPHISDPDSLVQVRLEIVQLLLIRKEYDAAAAELTDEVRSTATARDLTGIFMMLARGYIDAESYEKGSESALNAVSYLRVLQMELAAQSGGTALESAQRGAQDQYFAQQYAGVGAFVDNALRQADKAELAGTFAAGLRARLGDSLYAAVEPVMRRESERLAKGGSDTGGGVDKAAPAWAAHTWIGTPNPLDLTALKGKVVLVDFFATWCRPCIMAFEHIRKWHEAYAKDGLAVVGLTTYQGRYNGAELGPGEELAKLREDFIPKHKLSWPVGVENSGRATMDAYGVQGIPHVVLIDRQGVVRYVKMGASDYEQTEKMIKKLLAQ